MYEEAFHFATRPFSILPDASRLCWTDNHRQAFHAIDLGVRGGAPLTLMTGEVGCGKTTLVRHFLATATENFTIGLLSSVFRGHLLEWALFAFGQPFANESFVTLVDRLQSFLVEEYASGRNSVLIVDEAQHLTDQDLETLRLLLNINAGSDLLLQIVLVGQPELRERLSTNEHRQIVQRISSDVHLRAMTADETADYIRDRLVLAGGSERLFDDSALEIIHSITKGVPRKINLLCDLCLVIAFAEEADRVDAALVNSAVKDLRKNQIYRTLTEVDQVRPAHEAAARDNRETSGCETKLDGNSEHDTKHDRSVEFDVPTGEDSAARTRPAREDRNSEDGGPSQNTLSSDADRTGSEQVVTTIDVSGNGTEAEPGRRSDAEPGNALAKPGKGRESGTADGAANVVTLASRVATVGEPPLQAAALPATGDGTGPTGSAATPIPDRRDSGMARPRRGRRVAATAACLALVGGLWTVWSVTDHGRSAGPTPPDVSWLSVLDTPEQAEAAFTVGLTDERLLPPVARDANTAARRESFNGGPAPWYRGRTVTASAERMPPAGPGRPRDGSGLPAFPEAVSVDAHGPIAPTPMGPMKAADAPVPIGLEASIPVATGSFDRAIFTAASVPALLWTATPGSGIGIVKLRLPFFSDAPILSPPRARDEALPPVGLSDMTAPALAMGGRVADAPREPVPNGVPLHADRTRMVRLATPAEMPTGGAEELVFESPRKIPDPDRAPPHGRLVGSVMAAETASVRVPHPRAPRNSDVLAARESYPPLGTADFGMPFHAENRDPGNDTPSSPPVRLSLAAPVPGGSPDLPGASVSERLFEMFVREARLPDRSGGLRTGKSDRAVSGPASASVAQYGTEHFLKALDSGLEDPTAAVIHYARAAISGHRRSAYYLGQIYESGDGVPMDLSLARVWYRAAGPDNQRAQRRMSEMPEAQLGQSLVPPLLLSSELAGGEDADFVWTSGEGADPAFYVLQMVERQSDDAVVAAVVRISATRLTIPARAQYWRVIAVDPAASRYATSAWKALPGRGAGLRPDDPHPSADGLAPSVIISVASTTTGQLISDVEETLDRLAIPVRVVTTQAPLGAAGAVYYFYDQDHRSAEAISRQLSIPVARIDPTPLTDFEIAMPLPGVLVIAPGFP